jgi:FKBP-type peptidyl-prolyl cis-trans isomerase FkpA
MKKLYSLLFAIIIVLSACKKNNTTSVDATAQAATDDAAIQAYIKTNNITAIKDVSGLYYQIITQGIGSNPVATSVVQVNYTGKLIDGTVFDSTTKNSSSLALNNTISGWQIGLPLLKTGGRILLLVPSGLGYGATANGSIPANSVLVFTIDLLSFK